MDEQFRDRNRQLERLAALLQAPGRAGDCLARQIGHLPWPQRSRIFDVIYSESVCKRGHRKASASPLAGETKPACSAQATRE